MRVEERFLNYVALDTQSDPSSAACPSTEKQRVLGEMLVAEMQKMGIHGVGMDGNGYIYGYIPATSTEVTAPRVAFIAHMDTSPDLSGTGVRPRIVKKYDGGDIVLNADSHIILSPEHFEQLKRYEGWDLIVTDGTTLLGADDKAGIAEILTMADYFLKHPEIPHGDIRIAFTPDEEIGRGADLLDLERLGADFGYTVDGGELGEVEYENFNAASARIRINGTNIHPGSAKGKMVNALRVAMEYDRLLPAFDRPEHTEGYEGFFHLNDLSGTVEQAHMLYIVRDHSRERFESKKRHMHRAAEFLNAAYGAQVVEVDCEDSYYNMREKIEPHLFMVEAVKDAMNAVGVEPLVVPVRGGTDGARLSYMGLPCPNICTGGHNFHGRYEYIPVQAMEKTVEILIELVKGYAK